MSGVFAGLTDVSEPDPADQVAGDGASPRIRMTAGPREIDIHAVYMGGNPTLARVREVTVTIPVLGVNDDIDEYDQIIRTVFAELANLAALSSYAESHKGDSSQVVSPKAEPNRAGVH